MLIIYFWKPLNICMRYEFFYDYSNTNKIVMKKNVVLPQNMLILSYQCKLKYIFFLESFNCVILVAFPATYH